MLQVINALMGNVTLLDNVHMIDNAHMEKNALIIIVLMLVEISCVPQEQYAKLENVFHIIHVLQSLVLLELNAKMENVLPFIQHALMN